MLALPVPLDPAQHERAQLVDQRLRARVPQLRAPIVATWETHHRLVVDRGVPWLFCPLDIDPFRNARGGYPLPADVRSTLTSLSDAGAAFDQIAIAHELDPSSRVLARLGDVPPHGLVLTPREAAKALGPTPPPETSLEGAAKIEERIRAVGRITREVAKCVAIATVAVPAAALAAVSDPIVFGVVGIDSIPLPARPVLYYPLAAWLW